MRHVVEELEVIRDAVALWDSTLDKNQMNKLRAINGLEKLIRQARVLEQALEIRRRPPEIPSLPPCPWPHPTLDSRTVIESKEIKDDDPVFWVECCGCGARGPLGDDKEHAVRLWVKDVQADAPASEIVDVRR